MDQGIDPSSPDGSKDPSDASGIVGFRGGKATGGGPGDKSLGREMQDLRTVAERAVAALQEWYGADPYARKAGLYSCRNAPLPIDRSDRNTVWPTRGNLMDALSTFPFRRHALRAMARWWNSANAITAVIGFMAATGDHSFLRPTVENTFIRAQSAYRPVNIHVSASRLLALNLASYQGFLNAYYDDEGWWALAWLGAYDLTGDEKYLACAKDIFADMAAAWDDTWGGGIYWGKYAGQPDRRGVVAVPRGWKGPYKNAIANELFIAVASALGIRIRDREPSSNDHIEYTQWALRGWEWFNSPPPQGVALINQATLVNDSPNSRGVNDNTKAIWSYNQGVILSALVDLTELTGDQSHLAWAERIAASFIGNRCRATRPRGWQPGQVLPVRQSGAIDGILHEHDECDSEGSPLPGGLPPGTGSVQFKGIFVRNLASLYLKTRNATFAEFILANARSAVSNMNERYQFGSNWAAPADAPDFLRQTAGVDLLNAALLVS
jgi:predicted alpha-1,6-mannanase (GH76 family)